MNMERVVGLRRIMAENGINGALVTSRANVLYLSGFDGDEGDLFITLDAAYILCDFRFLQQAAYQAPLFAVKDIKDGLYKAVNEITATHGVTKLGIEERALSFAAYGAMNKFITGATLIPMKNMIAKMREIKSIDEIENIRLAAKIADNAFADTVNRMKPGMTETEVAAELEYNMRKAGASKPSFDTIVASGKNSALPHGKATEKKLENGDFVVMDFGCIYNGYCSDMTRTVAVGEVSREQENIYNAVYFTQLKSLSKLKCEAVCSEIDAYSRRILDSFGLGDYFGHALGHSVGLDIHERPTLGTKSKEVLKPGMTVTVEPGVYINGKFGVRIEDLVLVGEKDNEILSHSPKNLIVI